MSSERVNQHHGNSTDSTRIVRATHVAQALTERYPRAIRGVTDVLSVALVVAFRSGYTFVALALHLLAFVAWAKVEEVGEWWHGRGYVEPEPMPAPYDWLRDICIRAKAPLPLVTADRPTAKGHEFDLLVTDWVEREGRPMTVDAWLAYKPLLRDIAGRGCKLVTGEPDPDHGGITTIEFHGIRLEEYVPPPKVVEPDPEAEPDEAKHPVCSIKGCHEPVTHHVVDPATPNAWVCAHHVDDTVALLGGELGWHDWDIECTWGRCSEPSDPEESDRKRTPDSDPLLPQVILPIDPREGSEAEEVWPAPTGRPAAPPVVRPPGATEGTRGGNMFDLLACAQGPLRRGTLAAAGPLSPTTADKLLTAWADLGVCRKVGQLWQIATDYSTSASLIPRGREEDAGE